MYSYRVLVRENLMLVLCSRNVRKFDGWIQNDRWATQIEDCELTVSRRVSKTELVAFLAVQNIAKDYLARDPGSKDETRIQKDQWAKQIYRSELTVSKRKELHVVQWI